LFNEIRDDSSRDWGKQYTIPVMPSRIVQAGNGAGAQDGKAVRRRWPQTGPGLQYRIASGMRRNLLRIRQEAAKASRSVRQIESHIFIRRADHKLSRITRHEI